MTRSEIRLGGVGTEAAWCLVFCTTKAMLEIINSNTRAANKLSRKVRNNEIRTTLITTNEVLLPFLFTVHEVRLMSGHTIAVLSRFNANLFESMATYNLWNYSYNFKTYRMTRRWIVTEWYLSCSMWAAFPYAIFFDYSH